MQDAGMQDIGLNLKDSTAVAVLELAVRKAVRLLLQKIWDRGQTFFQVESVAIHRAPAMVPHLVVQGTLETSWHLAACVVRAALDCSSCLIM